VDKSVEKVVTKADNTSYISVIHQTRTFVVEAKESKYNRSDSSQTLPRPRHQDRAVFSSSPYGTGTACYHDDIQYGTRERRNFFSSEHKTRQNPVILIWQFNSYPMSKKPLLCFTPTDKNATPMCTTMTLVEMRESGNNII
jgi:hypothetical protein